MSTTMQPPPPRRRTSTGSAYTMADYKGGDSTLCAGCGHDAITSQIIKAFYEYGVEPYRVAKLSGIGCSSKTPAYFLSQLARFQRRSRPHAGAGNRRDAGEPDAGLDRRQRRRRYGLDRHGPVRSPAPPQCPDDLHHREQRRVWSDQRPVLRDRRLRLESQRAASSTICPRSTSARWPSNWAATSSPARSPATRSRWSRLLKARSAHRGTALFDVISPCVTFNNHDGSTKSYKYAKDHEELLHEISFVPFFEQITVDYTEGEARDVELHDGSHIRAAQNGARL